MRLISHALGRDHLPPEELAYRRLREKGFVPAHVIDVGAYEGNWTRLARRVFPEAPVLMIEAQPAKRPLLERVCQETTGIRYLQALLGRTSGETVTFFEMETGSSMFPENSDAPRVETRLTTSRLDDLAGPIEGPALLKIDVQGAEIEVLEGGPKTLAACEVVQLEVALLPYNAGAPGMREVLNYMAEKDFAPFDISGFSRPDGINLAQIDMLFARSSSPLRNRFFEF